MPTTQVVIEKAKEVGKIALDYVSQAASKLVGSASEKAGDLSLAEMSRRLDGALRVLRGEEVSISGAAAPEQKTSLQITHKMMESYSFDIKAGTSTFTIPANVTDVEAMKALNKYFRKYHPNFKRDAVYARDLDWYENLPTEYPTYCQKRDYSQARQITVTGVVKGEKGENRTTEEGVLKDESPIFSDPRDQALAAAIHACKYKGEDLFKDLWVSGSVPGFALCTGRDDGVFVSLCHVNYDDNEVAAFASTSPESK